jgi:hypothetical protein
MVLVRMVLVLVKCIKCPGASSRAPAGFLN